MLGSVVFRACGEIQTETQAETQTEIQASE